MHFKFYFVYGIVCLNPHECGLRIHYSCQDLTCSFTTSVEISSYTTSWKPYYKNPGYAPAGPLQQSTSTLTDSYNITVMQSSCIIAVDGKESSRKKDNRQPLDLKLLYTKKFKPETSLQLIDKNLCACYMHHKSILIKLPLQVNTVFFCIMFEQFRNIILLYIMSQCNRLK